MLAHPVLVGNEGVLDTDIMHFSGGRIVAKVGAKRFLYMTVPDRGLGIATASEDGMTRGLGPAAIATAEQLELANGDTLRPLPDRHAGPVTSFTGEPVGDIRFVLGLRFAWRWDSSMTVDWDEV
jgi:L-asparaginase II